MSAANLAIIMFLLILTGYAARKFNIVDERFGQSLSMFLYDFVFPAIIISSMSIPSDKGDSRNFLHLILIGTFTMPVMVGLSLLGLAFIKFTRGKKSRSLTPKEGDTGLAGGLVEKKSLGDSFPGIMTFAMMFPNFTFMAYPVMEALFPDKGLLYISIYTVPVRLVIYIAGPLLVKPPSQKGVPFKEVARSAASALLTPPVIAVPIGLLVYYFNITFPAPIAATLDYLAKTATPMGMVVTGILLAQASLGKLFSDKRMYIFTVLRLVIAPVLVFLALYKLPLDPTVIKLSVIYSALPAASTTTVMALQYKGDASMAAGAVFLSTVFSIISIPLCAYILDFML